jgi:gas vesicle protein
MKTFGKFLAGFVLGGITGSLIGLLFAPTTGSQTKAKIKDNIYYVRDEVQKAANQRSEELKKELAFLQKKA